MTSFEDTSDFSMQQKNCLQKYQDYLRNGTTYYFDVEEFEFIIDNFIYSNDIDQAKQALELAFRIHPDNSVLKQEKVKLLMINSCYQEAILLIDEIGLIDTNLYALKADALLQLGKIDSAIALFKNYLYLTAPSEKIAIITDIATSLNNCQQEKHALYFLEIGLSIDPKSLIILQEMASTYERLKEYAKAIDIYNQVLDIDPYNSYTWFLLGSLYYSQEQFKEAINCFEFAIAINQKDTLSWLQIGHCYFNLDLFQDAIQAYNHFIVENTDNSSALTFVAECYENLDQYDRAKDYYLKAIQTDETCIEAYIGYAICLMESNLFTEALPYIEKAQSIDPDNAEIITYKGEIFAKLAQKENSIPLYSKALDCYLHSYQLNNEQYHLLLEIGNIYLTLGQYSNAEHYLLEALENQEESNKLPYQLATVYYKLEDYDQMKRYLNLAQQQDELAFDSFFKMFPDAKQYF